MNLVFSFGLICPRMNIMPNVDKTMGAGEPYLCYNKQAEQCAKS